MEGTKKVVVGIFVGGCLLLFGVGLFLIGSSNQLFSKSFEVYAEFSKITGIVDGSKVRVGGMDAGTVTSIDVPSRPEGKFRIHFRIIEKLHPLVRSDSVASIQTDGLLGNKFLQVDAGSSSAALAPDKSMIQSTEPFDWSDLMDQISKAVDQVNVVLSDSKEQLAAVLGQIEDVSRSANVLIKDATPQVERILASADRIGANLDAIIDGVQQGRGTVGAVFKDEELSASVKRSVAKTEETVENVRDTTGSVKRIAKDIEDSNIVPEVQRVVKELQQISASVKNAVEKFQSSSGEGGVMEDLQRTLAHANEAMSDLSDNTEAIKHNFFLRGFFKRRGFYDLDALTTTAYQDPDFGDGFNRFRIWLESKDLFEMDAKGQERLSDAGKRKLDEALTDVVTFPRNGPLILEGYAYQGTDAERYLLGRQRADMVERYVVRRFQLRPGYIGVVSMSTAAPVTADANSPKSGVAIVSFYK